MVLDPFCGCGTAGIDGKLYFHDDSSNKSKQIILSVKGGQANVGNKSRVANPASGRPHVSPRRGRDVGHPAPCT